MRSLTEQDVITTSVKYIFRKKKIELIFTKVATTKKNLNSMIKSISLKCNFIVDKKNSISYARALKKYVYLNKKRTFVIINFEATGNFISRQLINKSDVKQKLKKDSYNLIILNKESLSSDNNQILYEIKSITLMINIHKKQLFLNIIRMINHDIVLKIF